MNKKNSANFFKRKNCFSSNFSGEQIFIEQFFEERQTNEQFQSGNFFWGNVSSEKFFSAQFLGGK